MPRVCKALSLLSMTVGENEKERDRHRRETQTGRYTHRDGETDRDGET